MKSRSITGVLVFRKPRGSAIENCKSGSILWFVKKRDPSLRVT
jgi:hypothetical protein